MSLLLMLVLTQAPLLQVPPEVVEPLATLDRAASLAAVAKPGVTDAVTRVTSALLSTRTARDQLTPAGKLCFAVEAAQRAIEAIRIRGAAHGATLTPTVLGMLNFAGEKLEALRKSSCGDGSGPGDAGHYVFLKLSDAFVLSLGGAFVPGPNGRPQHTTPMASCSGDTFICVWPELRDAPPLTPHQSGELMMALVLALVPEVGLPIELRAVVAAY